MQAQMKKKHIILLVIDSLMDAPLQKAINNGDAPALRFFIENGQYISNLVSPFPTMSVTIDSTLLTGTYAEIHKLPGLVWFNHKEKRLINYGSHIRELLKLGLTTSLEDILFRLNNEHLSKEVKTIHEEIEEMGKQSASINALVYRGKTKHSLTLPKILTLFTSLKNNRSTNGPKRYTYGSLSRLSPSKKHCYFWQKYGFNDKFSVQQLSYLIKNDLLPEFSLAYFPNLDKSVHKHGPMDLKGIEKVDQQLQNLLNSYHSWDEALKETVWIVMGDSGQAFIYPERNKALIDLRQLLRSYKIMKLKDGLKSDDQIVLAVNERMTYIYSLDLKRLPLAKIAKALQDDKRIDVIAWREKETVYVTSGIKAGELRFQRNGNYIDQYEQSWTVTGDLELLDLTMENNILTYGHYPDALARLHSSLTSHEGDYLVVCAKPGHEFIGEGSPTHVGGASHGGLHEDDSLVPMIVTGTATSPKHARIVDLKDWILTLID